MSSIGRYEVVERLGSGGFATVYLVRDPVLDSQVAAKVLADNWAGSAEVRERFIREAQLLRRIDSQRVVTVHDIGELPSGQPYFVMSLANRGTLEGRLGQRAVAPARRDVGVLAQELAACVQAVHDHDLIHRDIKPSNLLITGGRSGQPIAGGTDLIGPGERLVLGDFGLAKDIALQAGGATITAGTGGYAGPEQMSVSGDPNRQTDLYAATAVMYRVIANATPSAFDLGKQLVPFPDGAWWMIGHLGQFFRQGMTFNQADRHGSVEEWLAAFIGAYDQGELQGFAGPSSSEPEAVVDAQSAPTGVIGLDNSPASGPGSWPTGALPQSPGQDMAPPLYVPPSALSTGSVQPPLPPAGLPSTPEPAARPQDQPFLTSPQDVQPSPFAAHPPAQPGWMPAAAVEPVRRSPKWPLLFLTLLVLLMAGAGAYLLASGSAGPMVVGPSEMAAGESQEFRATFDGAADFRWTDWENQVTFGDTFVLKGIVAGPIRFKVEALSEGDVSGTTTHEVLIIQALDAPRIVGPSEIRVGVEQAFTFESPDGSNPEWTDANGPKQGEVYRLTGTSPGPFEITLVVTRPDGVTRVGTRRVIQIVE